jgi:hypothetical protein
MSVTVLGSREGAIWAKRPAATSSGLVSTVVNRKPRSNGAVPPFRDVAFARHGLVVASVDARGHVCLFDLALNRYRHVKHTGSPGVRLVFGPSTQNDVVVALEDGSVRVCGRGWGASGKAPWFESSNCLHGPGRTRYRCSRGASLRTARVTPTRAVNVARGLLVHMCAPGCTARAGTCGLLGKGGGGLAVRQR